MTRRARATASVLLAAAGGLALAAGTAGGWVREETVREVGGVPVTDVTVTSGLELAPQGLALGLGAAVAGLALLLVRGRAQVVLGVALAVTGGAALALALGGMASAPAGATGGGVVTAMAGASGVLLSGVLVFRPAPPPRLGARYDVDEDERHPDDDEWHLAASDPGEEGPA